MGFIMVKVVPIVHMMQFSEQNNLQRPRPRERFLRAKQSSCNPPHKKKSNGDEIYIPPFAYQKLP